MLGERDIPGKVRSMRINVTDRARIFAKQLQGKNGAYTSYSTSLGKKNQDGTWDNGRLFVEFQ